jgi:hypothetical protein
MKRSLVALSILAGTLSNPVLANSVAGFSAASLPIKGNVGNLNINTPIYLLSSSNTAVITIDISAARNNDEAVSIIRESNPEPLITAMLENYPAAPITAEGIAAFEQLTGTQITSDSEFKALIDARLSAERYVGLSLRSVSGQNLITQTATKTIVSVAEDELYDVYSCETSSFIPTAPVSEQEICEIIDSGVDLNQREIFAAHNGSYLSEKFLYTDLNLDVTRYYREDGQFDIPMTSDLDIRSIAQPSFVFAPGEIFNKFSSDGYFKAFRVSPIEIEEVDIAMETGLQPASFVHFSGYRAFYDKTDENGIHRIFNATAPLFFGDWSERPMPLKLKILEQEESYGFIPNFDHFDTQDSPFGFNNKDWMAVGYYGSKDLGVITPAILNLDGDRLIYLSKIAVKHLEESTPEGFIDAVRSAVIESLPQALLNTYPTLPTELAGLDIDPDMTQDGYAALINEKIVRVATSPFSGALADFENGRSINVTGISDNNSYSLMRWASNEFRFTSTTTLRAPFVSYEFTQPDTPELSISVTTTELSSTEQQSADITVTASGNYQEVLATCEVVNSEAEVIFSAPSAGNWGESSSSMTYLRDDQQLVTVSLTNSEETQATSSVLEATLTAINGAGGAEVVCRVTGTDMFGESRSSSRALNFTISTPVTVSGQFNSDDGQLIKSAISADLIAAVGNRSSLSILDDLSFNQPVAASGNYVISPQANGYVMPCVEFNAPLGITELADIRALRGDLNNDGEISSTDQWRFYFRAFYPSTDFDLNNDGAVNNADRDIIRNNRGAVQCDL